MRRFLLLSAGVAVVAGGLVAVLVLADSPSDTPPGNGDHRSPQESTPSAEESPRSPDDSPEETPEVVGASSPREASELLLAAWIDADQQDALEVAEPRAVESLFRLRAAPGYELKGCQADGTRHSCAFFLESGGGAGAALLMLVEDSGDSGFRVNQVKSIGAN